MILIKKGRKSIIFSTIIFIVAIISLFLVKLLTVKQIPSIPLRNKVSSIEIYHDYINNLSKHHSIKSAQSISEIYNVLLSGKKSNILTSLDDSPSNVNGKPIKIVLTDSSNTVTLLFAYQGTDGKYYIEKPYEGIYKISVQGYETLSQVN